MYYGSGTVAHTVSQWHHTCSAAGGRWYICSSERWADVRNPTPSIDAYLVEEQPCSISSQSDLKWRSFRLFEEGRPNKNKKKQKNKRLIAKWYGISSWSKNHFSSTFV